MDNQIQSNPIAHWAERTDFSVTKFFIRRMDTSGFIKPARIPATRLPMIAFIWVTSGEVLIDVDGSPYLCQSGQLLLIPVQLPFSIRYYHEAIGYTGGFAESMLRNGPPLRQLSKAIHQGFWFDEGAFVAMLFEMLAVSFDKGDRVFIEKGLDLLMTRVKPEQKTSIPPAVSRFLESVFDPKKLPGTIAAYAEEIGISENYLSRLVKQSTGHSVGAWIDIVRIQRSKLLLSTTATPIIDIAASVGIEDQSYFSRLFKRETGLTPSNYRKEMQG